MSEPLCVVCKRAREHGIHQWTGYERLRHPDYHEFTTPTDSAVTCTCASPNNRDGTRREVCPVHRDSAITAEAVAMMVADLRAIQHPDKPWAQDAADTIEDLTAERDRLSKNLEIALRGAKDRELAWQKAEEALEAAEARAAELEAALTKISEHDVPRPVGEPWAKDGRPSKHDKCTHGNFMWEGCDNCTAEFASAALTPQQREASGGKEGPCRSS